MRSPSGISYSHFNSAGTVPMSGTKCQSCIIKYVDTVTVYVDHINAQSAESTVHCTAL